MTELTIEAGICGFVTTVRTDSPDGGMTVTIDFDTACPVYAGFPKAIEAAAGMALPGDVSMKFAPRTTP